MKCIDACKQGRLDACESDSAADGERHLPLYVSGFEVANYGGVYLVWPKGARMHKGMVALKLMLTLCLGLETLPFEVLSPENNPPLAANCGPFIFAEKLEEAIYGRSCTGEITGELARFFAHPLRSGTAWIMWHHMALVCLTFPTKLEVLDSPACHGLRRASPAIQLNLSPDLLHAG